MDVSGLGVHEELSLLSGCNVIDVKNFRNSRSYDATSSNSLQHTNFMQCNNSFASYGSYLFNLNHAFLLSLKGVDDTKSVIVAVINKCHANIFMLVKPLYSRSTQQFGFLPYYLEKNFKQKLKNLQLNLARIY